jgi:hypothetical protein
MSFFSSGQPLVIPEPNAGGVQTITAGSNVVITGTAINPVINATEQAGGVATVTAGSNVTLTGTATNPIVNVVTGANGSSADNIPIPSSTPGAPVVQTITNTNQANYYTVAAELFPQSAAGTNVYRFTFNGFFGAGTLTGGSGGIIEVMAGLGPTNQFLCGTNLFASTTVSPLDSPFSMSALFIPDADDAITILVRNNSGGTLSNLSLIPSQKGCGIELVSSNSSPQLIFS